MDNHQSQSHINDYPNFEKELSGNDINEIFFWNQNVLGFHDQVWKNHVSNIREDNSNFQCIGF